MSDPLEGSTPSPEEVEPESEYPEDPATLQSAQGLDEDELDRDPLERGVEPPEEWSEVSQSRPTPRSQREGETVEDRLAEERPDTTGVNVDASPLAATRMHEVDESVDEYSDERLAGDEDERDT